MKSGKILQAIANQNNFKLVSLTFRGQFGYKCYGVSIILNDRELFEIEPVNYSDAKYKIRLNFNALNRPLSDNQNYYLNLWFFNRTWYAGNIFELRKKINDVLTKLKEIKAI